jgi:hypothetical protein
MIPLPIKIFVSVTVFVMVVFGFLFGGLALVDRKYLLSFSYYAVAIVNLFMYINWIAGEGK